MVQKTRWKHERYLYQSCLFKDESERDIDIIFTGTTIQKTKNYDLFYNLVDKLLSEDHQVIILDNLSTGNIDNLSKQARESFIYKDIYSKYFHIVYCKVSNSIMLC